jgi:transcriptional regulator with XRE-family HTH domain
MSRLLYERGWSDSVLAVEAGISRSRVNRLKNRRARPTVRDALLIAAALGVPVETVFWLDQTTGGR